jgi:DNA-binding transcriptional ArsR family regulator
MGRVNSTGGGRASSAAVSARPIVRELGGLGQRLEVAFDARTAYDFVVSIKVGSERDADLLPQDADWLDRTLSSLTPEARADIEKYFGEDSLGLPHLLPALILQQQHITDAASLIRAARAMPTDELAALLLSGLLGKVQQADRVDEIVAGDVQALDSACEPFDDKHREQLAAFVANRRHELDRMLSVLEAWLPSYREVEPRVARMLKRDVAERGDGVPADQVVDLIERTTGGLRWFPEAGVRRVILAPQYFGRPFNYVFQGADWRMFAYPLAESALGPSDGTIPPQSMVRLYRALGDATRMRILRLLSDRDWYLTELAQQLELSKPTMKHHLALMRSAGLVTVIEQGGLTYYSLRRERLREAGVELQHYIS